VTTTHQNIAAPLDVGAHIGRFNRICLFATIGYALASIILWGISFWIVLSVVTTMFLQWNLYDHLNMAWWISLSVMGLLFIEGIRTMRHEALDTYDPQTSYVKPQMLTDPVHTMNAAKLISELLLSAPHTMARAIRSFRRRVSIDKARITESQRIFDDLQRVASWRDVRQYPGKHAELALLQHVGLIWLQEKEGRVQVRVDPGYT